MAEQDASVTRESPVSLREVTKDTLTAVLKLKVKPEQEQFVAPNAVSIAQAHFEEKAWFRAIYAGDVPVGFVMLYDDPEEPQYYLWRFMIDGRYQRFGFGRQALQQVIDYVRARPHAHELLLSYVPAEGSPQPFYAGLGFADTGEEHEGELVMKLKL